ncbi:MAG: MutS-related protein family 1 [Myxococcaceae bacterium]|nr:MutS-related protein family 1 [Myxococcaceae bacterium]
MRYEGSVNTVNERASGHESRVRDLSIQRDQLETKANRISLFRLITFVGAASALVAGIKQALPLAFVVAALLALVFVAAVAWHARVIEHKRGVEVRIEINRRHLKRIAGHWHDLPSRGEGLVDPSHPYASDIDLTGTGSLFQRIDVSQTREGERALATALSEPAAWPLIEARHPAVLELTTKEVFREEIEALGSVQQQRSEKLDHSPFMALFTLPSLFAKKRWLKPVALLLLTITLTTLILVQLDVLPSLAIWACVLVQGLLLYTLREPVHGALDLLTARLGFAQAYQTMLRAIELESFSAPYLQGLQRRLRVQGSSASALMARLSRYEGFAQLRTQGPLYIVLNLLTLWDLFCLERIERFAADVGPHCGDWFKVVAEIELLCSFATLHHVDADTVLPLLDDTQVGLQAEGLLHPLLPYATRVANDLTLPGSGTALLVTGSNMAGKSTLLRSVGLNVALALAGAPVCARSFSVSLVRLRASMRIDDSLQRGASYFHAELTRLRMVVGELDTGAPVLFLLDELLRGTNAHARHQGARAVLLHLLQRGALGLVATHDVALAELEDELPGQIENVHFTDVFENGEMRFDYTLREGVVKTSNALRLLALAGIEVPDAS